MNFRKFYASCEFTKVAEGNSNWDYLNSKLPGEIKLTAYGESLFSKKGRTLGLFMTT